MQAPVGSGSLPSGGHGSDDGGRIGLPDFRSRGDAGRSSGFPAFEAAENPSEAHLINGFSFDGELTGIAEVADDNKIDGNTTIYNMSGQRLSVPVKGLNIINGKKIFIK